MPSAPQGSRNTFIEKAKRHLNDGNWLGLMLAMDALISTSKGNDPSVRFQLMEAHRMRATAMLHMSKFDEAVAEFQLALELSKELGDRVNEAKSLFGLGDVSWNMGDTSLAKDFFKESRELAMELGDLATEAQAIIGLANTDMNKGSLELASEGFKQAIDILSTLEPSESLSRAYNNMGEVMCHLGRPDDALWNLMKAEEVADKVGNIMARGFVRANLSLCYARKGNLERAKDLVEKAIADLAKAHDQAGLVYATSARGTILAQEGKYEQALQEIRKAETMAMRDGLDGVKAGVLFEKGIILAKMDSAYTARMALTESRQLYDKLGNTLKAKEIDVELAKLGPGK